MHKGITLAGAFVACLLSGAICAEEQKGSALSGSVCVDKSSAFSGAGSLKIVARGTQPKHYTPVTQRIKVRPGVRFRLRACMRQENVAGTHLKVYFFDAEGRRIRRGARFLPLHDKYHKVVSSSWQEFETQGVVPPGAVEAVIFCMGGWRVDFQKPGASWFDDISMSPFQIRNGGFEQGLTGWDYQREEEILKVDFESPSPEVEILKPELVSITSHPEEVISGKGSLRLNLKDKSADVFRIRTHFEGGRDYVISFDYRVLEIDRGNFFNLSLRAPGEMFVYPVYGALRGSKKGECGSIVRKFRVPMGASYDYMWCWVVSGKGRLRAILDNIRISVVIPPKTPPREVPHPLWPRKGMRVSSFAVSFQWTKCGGNCVAYEIELARDEGFKDVVRRIKAVPLCPTNRRRESYKPWGGVNLGKAPIRGRWYWRVRAVNFWGQKGKWSEPSWFEVDDKMRRIAPAFQPSPEHPYFMLYASGLRPKQALESLPADLRRFCILEDTGKEIPPSILEEAEREGIAMAVFLRPLHFPDGFTLAYLEHLFQRYKCVKAVHLMENYGMRGARRLTEYFREGVKNVIRLAAKYGRVVVWSDAHVHYEWWIDVGLDEGLYGLMKKYRDYVIVTDKGSVPTSTLLCRSALMGLWLSGAVKNWGLHIESWYWRNAGFGREETGGIAVSEGGMPPAFWGQMMLSGIASGATFFYFQPRWHIWRRPGELAPTWKMTVQPLIREIVNRKLIPDKQEVASKIKVVCLARNEDGSGWGARPLTRSLDVLMEAVYGVGARSTHLVPKISRYFFLPIMPPHTSNRVLSSFASIVRSDQFADANDARRFLNQYYSREGRYSGDAWAVEVGGTWFISCTDACKEVTERYKIVLNWAPIASIAGKVGPTQYLLVERIPRGIRIHANNRTQKMTTITITATKTMSRLKPRTEPPSALYKAKWSDTRGELTIMLSHAEGAVSVEIR